MERLTVRASQAVAAFEYVWPWSFEGRIQALKALGFRMEDRTMDQYLDGWDGNKRLYWKKIDGKDYLTDGAMCFRWVPEGSFVVLEWGGPGAKSFGAVLRQMVSRDAHLEANPRLRDLY